MTQRGCLLAIALGCLALAVAWNQVSQIGDGGSGDLDELLLTVGALFLLVAAFGRAPRS